MLTISVFPSAGLCIKQAQHPTLLINPGIATAPSPAAGDCVAVTDGQYLAEALTYVEQNADKHLILLAGPEVGTFVTPDSCTLHALGMGSTFVATAGLSVTRVPSTSTSTYCRNVTSQPVLIPGCGWVVRAAGHCLYVGGHTGTTSELRFVGEIYKPNVSILAIDPQTGIGLDTLPRVLAWLGSDMLVPWPLSAAYAVDELHETVDAYTSAFCKRLAADSEPWQLPATESSGRRSGPESRY
jgi:hypothetical protein